MIGILTDKTFKATITWPGCAYNYSIPINITTRASGHIASSLATNIWWKRYDVTSVSFCPEPAKCIFPFVMEIRYLKFKHNFLPLPLFPSRQRNLFYVGEILIHCGGLFSLAHRQLLTGYSRTWQSRLLTMCLVQCYMRSGDSSSSILLPPFSARHSTEPRQQGKCI